MLRPYFLTLWALERQIYTFEATHGAKSSAGYTPRWKLSACQYPGKGQSISTVQDSVDRVFKLQIESSALHSFSSWEDHTNSATVFDEPEYCQAQGLRKGKQRQTSERQFMNLGPIFFLVDHFDLSRSIEKVVWRWRDRSVSILFIETVLCPWLLWGR